MTELLRLRVDATVLEEVNKKTAELGTTTPELIRIFLKAVVSKRGLPILVCFPEELAEEVAKKIRGSKEPAGQPAAGDPVSGHKGTKG